MDNQLLENWEYKPLSEIALINPRLDKKKILDETEVSFVPMSAVEAESGQVDVSETTTFAAVKKGYTAFQERDVLFAKITPCMENGKMAIVPKLKNNLGFGSTEFHVIRSLDGTLPEYIYYFVSSKKFRFDAEHNMTGGVGQRRVPTTYLQNIKIPLPAYAEQQNIVAKIEELFSELDSGIASLKTAQQQLSIYRQSLLKHAFEGKLTEQWRKDNADKLETPEQLLARIQQEREERYQQQLEEWQQAVKEWEAKDKEGRSPRKPSNLKKLKSLELKDLPNLPKLWSWVKVGELVSVGTGVTPKRSNEMFYKNGSVSWVTSGALNKAFVREASDYVTEQALDETSLRVYQPHTLLIALYGEGKTRGKCSELLIEATTNQAVAALETSYLPRSVRQFMKLFFFKNYQDMRTLSSGGVQPNLNLGIIENMAIPFCSLAEQKEIVNQLEEKLSIIEQNAKEIETALAKAELLRQSILKKAFSGKLISTEAS